jgi:uncharacterized protein YkwD
MRFILTISFIILNYFGYAQSNPQIKEAYVYLNKIRQNPNLYTKDIGINLSGIASRPNLLWNDTLASVAQKKAEDMVKRSYFGHTDPDGNGINILILREGFTIPEEWTIPKSNNYFESLSAGNVTPKEGIIYLIKDGGVVSHKEAGHRNHLLGIEKFYANLTDIGIGWATGGKYGTYMCVIIAKHQW